jgi:hypothetical protein
VADRALKSDRVRPGDAMQSSPSPSLIRLLAGLALDYLRWTQLIPMIMAWTFLLIMVAAMLLTNFQQQSFELIDSGVRFYERFAGPLEPVEEAQPSGQSESLTWSGDDLRPLVIRLWGLLAAAGWLLGMAWRLLFGARPRASLTRKLLLAGVAGLVCSVLFLFSYFFGSESFNDPFWQWLLLFFGIPFVVWCISAWSLSIGWAIGRLQDRPAVDGSASVR